MRADYKLDYDEITRFSYEFLPFLLDEFKEFEMRNCKTGIPQNIGCLWGLFINYGCPLNTLPLSQNLLIFHI